MLNIIKDMQYNWLVQYMIEVLVTPTTHPNNPPTQMYNLESHRLPGINNMTFLQREEN
jgi:hypothetical protein